MSRSIMTIESEIKRLEAELAAAKAEKAELDRMDPVKRLAIELHSSFCNMNHIDMCGWDYEFKNRQHDWTGHAHKRYLEKAARIHAQFRGREGQISEFLKLSKELGL